MKNVLSVLQLFQGTIGALAGGAVTLIVTHFLKSRGRIISFIKDVNIVFYGDDDAGGFYVEESQDPNKAHYGSLSFVVEVYNSAETAKYMRDIQLKFYDRNRCLIISKIPVNESTRRPLGGGSTADNLTFINLTPKRLMQVSITSTLSEEDCSRFEMVKNIYLEFEDMKGKQHRELIKAL